jgi:AcrR family transcriptional regulator
MGTPLTKGLATQQRVLNAAVTRFADHGFRQTSVAQIARDAGVTAPAVHGYFGSKEELFRAAFAHDVADLLAVVRGRLAGAQLPGLGANLLYALLAEVPSHPLVGWVLRGMEPERTVELLNLPVVAGTRAQMVEVVAQAQASGRLRTDLEPAALAGALETLLLALLLGAVQIGMIGDEARRAALAAIVAKGITPVDVPALS